MLSIVLSMDQLSSNNDLSDLLNSANGCEYTDLSDICLNKTKHTLPLNVLHLNIRSLHRNKDNLTMLLNELQKQGILVHVVALCETFLSEDSKLMCNIENYSATHACRDSRAGGGGVSILVHDSVCIKCVLNQNMSTSFE